MDMPSYVTFGYNTRPFLNTSIDQVSNFTITWPFDSAARNHGAELAWQQPFGHGFGGLVNYTYANGHRADGPALLGSSKSTGDAEVHFQKLGFSARRLCIPRR